MTEKPAGDSSVQREAERWMVNKFSEEIGLHLEKKSLNLGEGIVVDGFHKSPLVMCEAWAHL